MTYQDFLFLFCFFTWLSFLYSSCKIKITKACGYNALLILDKQRFLCKNCNKTFTASTDVVEYHKQISNDTNLNIKIELMQKSNISHWFCNYSWMLFGVDVKNHKQNILKPSMLIYHLWKHFQDIPNLIKKESVYYILDHLYWV